VKERTIWIVVAAVIAVLGLLALAKVGGFGEYEELNDPERLSLSLVFSWICGAPLLSALALFRQRRLLPLAIVLMLSTAVTYTLLEIGVWDESFALHHQKLLESTGVIALALALLGPLFALTRLRDLGILVLALVTAGLIIVAAVYGLILIGRRHAGHSSLTSVEILTVLAVTGFFLTPVIERALDAGPSDA
jgi:hypothetical protein